MSIHCLCTMRVQSQPLVDDDFSVGLAFASGFTEAFSSSWIGMASLTNLSKPFTFLIQDSVWSLNKDWTWPSILNLPIDCKLLCPRLGEIVHCFESILICEFLFDLEATKILGRLIWFSSWWRKSIEECVQLRLISSLLRSIVWITSGLLTISQIVARILATCFPVALHWLALLREEVV